MRTLLLFSIILLSLLSTPALAQINPNTVNTELEITLQPAYPQPEDQVSASINDSSGIVYGSTINWFMDDLEIPNSKNKRNVTFVATGNSTQTIKIVITTQNGYQKVVTRTIKPKYLDIIIEPQTRIPDFYQGRALPSIGSIVNATALVFSDGFYDNDMMYIWKVNNVVLEGGAVRGKDQISFITPMGRNFTLSLQVSTLGGTLISSRSITLPSIEPTLKFYTINPLFGISNKSINESLIVSSNSTTIRTEPYYLDTRIYNQPIIKQWEITNGTYSRNGTNPYEVTVQASRQRSGDTNLSFHVRDTKQFLQGAESNIKISF